MDETILCQNIRDEEGEILPNFELFPEFNFDVQPEIATNDLNEEQQLAEIANFIEENANENTVKKTKSDLIVFNRWLKSTKETRSLEDIPHERLDILLCLFFKNVHKMDGDEYEPQTLTSFQRSFERHLRKMGKSYSILDGPEWSLGEKTKKSVPTR